MKYLFTLLIIFAGINFLSAQGFEKISMDSLMLRLQQAKHPVVLNIWATWCAPCVEELPYLNEGVAAFEQEGVELWLLSMDFKKDLEKALPEFIQKNAYDAQYFWLTDVDADEFCEKIDPRWEGAIPVTLFYNPLNGYRKFLNRAITKEQVPLEIKAMINP